MSEKAIHSYPKLFTFGDRYCADILDGAVEITEKVDGSQFGFGRIGDAVHMRSKGAPLFFDGGQSMFDAAVAFVKSIEDKLPDGYVFHGEFLAKPRHNTLAYGRVPKGHIMLFGVSLPDKTVLLYDSVLEWADALGCEPIPLIAVRDDLVGKTYEDLVQLLDRESVLGKAKIEGIVLKNHAKTVMVGGQPLPIMCAKLVSERFKEIHKEEWGKNNLPPIERVARALHSEARWTKAVQRLRDSGELTETVRDIGPLLKSINQDILTEEVESIKDELLKLFWKDISRIAIRGFPEWYKQQLAERVLEAAE